MAYRYHMRGSSVIRKLTLLKSEPVVVSFLNAHAFKLAWQETNFDGAVTEVALSSICDG